MEETSNLALPYILPSQAQKHVTHNEALRRLDAVVQLAVISRGLGTPPSAPAEGSRYIVGGPASSDWAGRESVIAAWQDGAWAFYQPGPGWIAVVLDEEMVCFWDGTGWQEVTSGPVDAFEGTSIQNAPLVGVGTEADATNVFAAKLNNALWTARSTCEGGTGDLRYKLNKQGAANVLSLLMQSGYSGRAELGLVGSDNVSLKVSADGASWREALIVDSATGTVSMPNTKMLTDYCINMYADSGRFAGAGENALTIGGFAFPGYFTRYNSTTVAGLGKFLHNNTDYGGTAGTMNASIKDLVDRIRDSSFRRYGVEFWVAEFTHGSGTGSSFNHLAQTWYLSLRTTQSLRAPIMTFHVYVRAIDGDILIRWSPGQTIIVNGLASQDHVIIPPSSGWVSVTIQERIVLRESYSYLPMPFSLHTKAVGHRYQLACPALMGGTTVVDANVGVIAAANSWPS